MNVYYLPFQRGKKKKKPGLTKKRDKHLSDIERKRKNPKKIITKKRRQFRVAGKRRGKRKRKALPPR